MSVNFDPPPQASTSGTPAADSNALQTDAQGNPVQGGADGTTKRVDTGKSQIVQQSGDPGVDKPGQGQNVPRNDSPVLPRPQQFAVGGGGTSTRAGTTQQADAAPQSGQAQQTQQTQAPLATTRNRSASTTTVPQPDGQAPTQKAAPNAAPEQTQKLSEAAINEFVEKLDLPPELKEAVRQEALGQLQLLGPEAEAAQVFEELEAQANAAQKATAKLRVGQQTLLTIHNQVMKGQLTPEQAKELVANLKTSLQDLGETEEPLTQSLKDLDEGLEKFSNKLESSGPILKSLDSQWTAWKESGLPAKDIKAQLEANIDADPELSPEQKTIAKAAVATWKGVATGEKPPLDSFAPGVAAALKFAHGNASSLIANLVNSGLIKPDKFKAEKADKLDDPDADFDLEKAMNDAPGNVRFKVAANYMVMLAKIMSFLSLMKAQINALDGEKIQEMGELDRHDMEVKLELAYKQIEKILAESSADQRAMAMEGGMQALTIIIAAISVVLAIMAVLSFGTLAGLVAAIIALIVAVFMFIIECANAVCKSVGADTMFVAIAKATGNPENAQMIEMIFGAAMAVASVATIAGSAAKLAAEGAKLGIKLASKVGVEVVKGVSSEMLESMSKQMVQQLGKQIAKQLAKETASAIVSQVLPTVLGMVIPVIATEIAKAAAPEDEETQMILQILLSIIMMIGVVAGGRVGGKAIGGGFGKGSKGALQTGKEAGQKLIDGELIEAGVGSLSDLPAAKALLLKSRAFFKRIAATMEEFFHDPNMNFKSGTTASKIRMGISSGASLFQGTAMLTAAVISMKAAEHRLEAAEAALEAEFLQGLIDILNALRKHRGRTKDGMIEDLEKGINELVVQQWKMNTDTARMMSENLSKAFMW